MPKSIKLGGPGFNATLELNDDGSMRFRNVDLALAGETVRATPNESGGYDIHSRPSVVSLDGATRRAGTPRGRGVALAMAPLLAVRQAVSDQVAHGALAASRDWRDRAQHAEDLAWAALQSLGLELPKVEWVPGNDAHAEGNTIRMGQDMAKTLSPQTLTQILMHEAGHVHEGHTSPQVNLLLHAFDAAGLLGPNGLGDVMRGQEHTADVYAAIGAWMFDPSERPSFSEWVGNLNHPATDTHPASADRALIVDGLVQVLDAAADAADAADGDDHWWAGSGDPGDIWGGDIGDGGGIDGGDGADGGDGGDGGGGDGGGGW